MCESADLAKAQQGDREAAGRVLQLHRGLLVTICNEMIAPGFELDDAIQEAYLAGLSAIKWFRPERGFKFATYLARCVRNRLATWLRTGRRGLSDEEVDEGGLPDVQAAVEAVDPVWLALVMRKMSRRDRQVLELRFGLSGGGALSVEAVRRRLGLSAATVRWIEEEAKKDLRFLAGPGHDPAG